MKNAKINKTKNKDQEVYEMISYRLSIRRGTYSIYVIDRLIYNLPTVSQLRKELKIVKQTKNIQKIAEVERYKLSTNFLTLLNNHLYYYYHYNPIAFYKALGKKVEVNDIFNEEGFLLNKEVYRKIKTYLINSRYLEEFINFVAEINDDRNFKYKYYKDINAFVVSSNVKKITRNTIASLNSRRALFHSRNYFAYTFSYKNPTKVDFNNLPF